MSPPKGLPTIIIACRVLQDVLEQLLPDTLAQDVTFMDYGLHRVPKNMTGTFQGALGMIQRNPTMAMTVIQLLHIRIR